MTGVNCGKIKNKSLAFLWRSLILIFFIFFRLFVSQNLLFHLHIFIFYLFAFFKFAIQCIHVPLVIFLCRSFTLNALLCNKFWLCLIDTFSCITYYFSLPF